MRDQIAASQFPSGRRGLTALRARRAMLGGATAGLAAGIAAVVLLMGTGAAERSITAASAVGPSRTVAHRQARSAANAPQDPLRRCSQITEPTQSLILGDPDGLASVTPLSCPKASNGVSGRVAERLESGHQGDELRGLGGEVMRGGRHLLR